MSHYAISRIRINPDPVLLEQVLQELAQELGAGVRKDAVVHGWSFSRKVDYLLEMPLMYGNGYGIELTGNGIRIHVDEHGAPLTAEQFADMLAKRYMAKAVKQALQELGFQVQEQFAEDQIVIVGEKQESWGGVW